MPIPAIARSAGETAAFSPGRAFRASLLALAVMAVLAGCSRQPTVDRPGASLPGAATTPLGSGSNAALADLGREIFFDRSLSDPPGQSCASCHDPRWAFATPHTLMQAGITPGARPGHFGMRNAPTLMYAAFSPPPRYDAERGTLVGGLMLDQRAASLEDQALRPFFNLAEMANRSPHELVAKLRAAPYARGFDRVFGRGALADPAVAMQRLAAAVAAYQRTPEFAPFSSKFDAVIAGLATFKASEQRGFEVFRDPKRGNCIACHTLGSEGGRHALFTDFSSHNLGLPANRNSPYYRMPPPLNPAGADFVDLGVATDPQRPGMAGRFRVPTLRNVSITSPYMHNGVFASLGETVRFYATACLPGNPEGWPAPEVAHGRDCSKVGRLPLGPRDSADLVDFMYTLADGWFDPVTGAPGPMQVPPGTPIIGSLGAAGNAALAEIAERQQ